MAIAIGDFTRSGIQDLIVADQGAANLSVLRGLGNGFFQPFVTQATGISPSWVAVGDFNRDGLLDLAIANYASNNINILLGNGNGTYRLFVNLDAHGPVSLAVNDFNGDGKPDLAVVENSSDTVSIFLGNGDGTFLPFFQSGVGYRPSSITVDDFNRDGKLDLAVANADSNSVSILLGIGNGTFQRPLEFSAGPLPAFVVSGDFNGDGRPDLAFANDTGFSTSLVSVLLGNGNGTFQEPLSFTVGTQATFLTTADFNLDGKLDLAVANTGSNTISVLMGIGNGTFQPALDFITGDGPSWIGVTDLNGDGKPDLVVANSISNNVSILLNRTPPLSGSAILVSLVGSAASFLTGAVAPGEILTISGSGLGPNSGLGFELTSTGLIGTALGETEVLFDGVPAPILYTQQNQLTVIVPFAASGLANIQMIVENNGVSSLPLTIPVAASAPALFTTGGNGIGQGAILNEDGSQNSAANPAANGSVIVLYATGAGQTNPLGIDGLLAGDILPTPVLPVSVTIGGQAAKVLYAGAAPGLVAGVMQVNALVPEGIHSGAVPVQLKVGNGTSQNGVMISVR